MKALLAVALLSLAAAGADAACTRPAGEAPAIPNGAKADEQSMKEAHDMIQTYVVQLEGYKTCLKTQYDNAPAGTSEEQKLAWLAQGDAAVDSANYLANQFSLSLKTFKEKTTPAQPAPASK